MFTSPFAEAHSGLGLFGCNKTAFLCRSSALHPFNNEMPLLCPECREGKLFVLWGERDPNSIRGGDGTGVLQGSPGVLSAEGSKSFLVLN